MRRARPGLPGARRLHPPRLLAALRGGEARITDLAAPLPISFAAVARHVSVLEGRAWSRATCAGASTGSRCAPTRWPTPSAGSASRRRSGRPAPTPWPTSCGGRGVSAGATARVERVLPAPPDVVYARLGRRRRRSPSSSPRRRARAQVEIDPRVGGQLRIVMTFPDRVTEIEGEYLALDRPHRISFSWRPLRGGFDSVVTVTFAPHGEGQTRMTITHSRLPQEWLGSYETGWGSIADALAAR